jgi:hypothetical protein
VAIQGANGVANDSRHLNRSANSTLLARDSNNNTLLQFAFSPTAAMRLNYATPIWTRSVVLLNPIYSNNTRVELGTNIIYLRLDDGTAENRQVYFDES